MPDDLRSTTPAERRPLTDLERWRAMSRARQLASIRRRSGGVMGNERADTESLFTMHNALLGQGKPLTEDD